MGAENHAQASAGALNVSNADRVSPAPHNLHFKANNGDNFGKPGFASGSVLLTKSQLNTHAPQPASGKTTQAEDTGCGKPVGQECGRTRGLANWARAPPLHASPCAAHAEAEPGVSAAAAGNPAPPEVPPRPLGAASDVCPCQRFPSLKSVRGLPVSPCENDQGRRWSSAPRHPTY